jgi:hypothetical protein
MNLGTYGSTLKSSLLNFRRPQMTFGGGGRVLDPDSIRSVDPDPNRNPDPDLGGQKLPTKKEKSLKISCFRILDVLFLRAEGFSCSKLKKLKIKISAVNVFQLFCHQTLDPDRYLSA